MNKTARFRKIPLKKLIDTLISVYNSGADYIDVFGETGNPQDVITISVIQEYMVSPEKEIPETKSLLTDEEIDNLLNQ
jgi:hypothetical protein